MPKHYAPVWSGWIGTHAAHAHDCPVGRGIVRADTSPCPRCAPIYYSRAGAKHRA